MNINSAFAGTVAYPRFSTLYRNQWPGLDNAFTSYSVGFDQFFPEKNLGAGLSIISDDQGNGTLKSTTFKGIISYNVRFGRDWQIKFGLGTAYMRNVLDWDRLIFFDQLDPLTGAVDASGIPNISMEVPPPSFNNSYLDIDVGLLLYNPQYYLGISLYHVNGPSDGFFREVEGAISDSRPVLLSVHGGYQISLVSDNKGNPKTFISPNILYTTQAGFNQVNVGAYVQKDSVFGGLWLRHTLENIDALIFSMGVVFNNLKIGYSYDLTTSELGVNTTSGSHEIGITLGLSNLEKKVSKLNDCFSLFR